jgi:hypothetical protein
MGAAILYVIVISALQHSLDSLNYTYYDEYEDYEDEEGDISEDEPPRKSLLTYTRVF